MRVLIDKISEGFSPFLSAYPANMKKKRLAMIAMDTEMKIATFKGRPGLEQSDDLPNKEPPRNRRQGAFMSSIITTLTEATPTSNPAGLLAHRTN